MELLHRLLAAFLKQRIARINTMRDRADQQQDELLRSLLSRAAGTEWGKKYGYSDISSAEMYRQRVPVSAYEALFPYIERSMKGEQNLLWHEPINCFSKSSGTTNARSKFIPVSASALNDCHFEAGSDMIAVYLDNHPESKVFTGKSMGIGGSRQPNHLNPKTYYGDISALLMSNLPIWARIRRTPDMQTALMDKWEEKIEKMARITAKENVTALAGVPTWTVVLIERIVQMTGAKDITEIWPNLEVFFHGAVAFDPYRELFNKLIPSGRMNYMETYTASEGFFAFQDVPGSDEMLLLTDYGIYYEFIPTELAETENPPAVPLHEVEIGKNYALVISTNAGLWRYKIGDTVKFTSLRPYRIKISGRTKHFINAFGEEVIVENAETAVSRACRATGAVMTDFTAGPVYLGEGGKRGGHEWIIEFEQFPDDPAKFNRILDETLREINSDYDAKRYMDIALEAPKIHHVPKGTFYDWMKKRNKLGGQNKVPRLANNRDYLDDILEMQGV